MGLLVLEGPFLSYAQDNPTTNPVVDSESGEAAPQEEHDTKDLEKLLKKYNTDSEKILEDTSKLHHIDNNEKKSEVNDSEIEEMPTVSDTSVTEFIEKSQRERSKPKVLPSELSASVRMALEPMQKLSEKELLKRLDDSTKDSGMRPYMDQFPNITIFAVRLIKDKDSIPEMVKIAEDRDRLISFASVMLFTIVFGFILKRLMHREGRSFPKAVLYFFIRLYLMFGIRVGVVYYFYKVELTPAARVFQKTFMN